MIDHLDAAVEARLVRKLGHSRPAIVYVAEDLEHRRKVVLEVLGSELAAVLGGRR